VEVSVDIMINMMFYDQPGIVINFRGIVERSIEKKLF
jgi:hypothetical protein